MKLPDVLNKQVVAQRYYALLDRTYDLRAAGRQLSQDRNVHRETLKKAVKELFADALKNI